MCRNTILNASRKREYREILVSPAHARRRQITLFTIDTAHDHSELRDIIVFLRERVKSCLVLSVYWPTLLMESNGHGWVRMLVGFLVM